MRILSKIFITSTLLSVCYSAPVEAQSQNLSLDEALSLTMANNSAIKASAFEAKAAEQNRRAAFGLRLPKINVMGGYTYLGKDIGVDFNHMKDPANKIIGGVLGSGIVPPALIPSIEQLITPIMGADWGLTIQDQSVGVVGGQVTMPIFLGGKINAANRAAKITEKSVILQGSQTSNALVSELVQRYYGLLLATQVVEVRQQVVDGVEKHLEDAIALENSGMIARSERLYVEFKMSEARRELENAQLQVQTISDALRNTLSTDGEYVPITSMFVIDQLEGVEYFKAIATKNNPLLNQVSLKRELAEQGAKVKRSEFMPQVVAMGGGSFYDYQLSGALPRWAVGVGVNFKIFDGLHREYSYSAARQTVKRVAILEQKAGEDVAILVEKIYNQMANFSNQIQSIDSSIAFADEYLRVKRAAFLEGMSSSSDLIDAELNLAKVRTERMEAAYKYDVLLAQLLEVSGISDEFAHYLRRDDAKYITYEQ